MYVLVALPVPRELQAQFAPLQNNQTFKNILRTARMEPHITLKAPQEIEYSLKDEWVQTAKEACAGFKPMDVRISSLNFITTSVLSLKVDHKALLPLHNCLVKNLERFNDFNHTLHEGDRFNSHITIGRAIKGPLNAAQRTEVLETLSPLIQPQQHSLRLVRLYGRDENAYRPLLDLDL